MKSNNKKKQPLDLEKELLKSDKIVTISNIFSLVLCSLGLGGVLLAMGLDQFNANMPYENILDIARAGVITGGFGIASTVATGLVEHRHEKLKQKVEKERVIKEAIKEADEELKEI